MTRSTPTTQILIDEAASNRLSKPGRNFAPSDADYLYLRYEGSIGRRAVWESALHTSKARYCAVAVPIKARQDFRELCLTLLELRYPDWAAAEGAAGSFVWDLNADRLIHSHRSCVDRGPEHLTAPQDNDSGLEEHEIPY